MTYEEKKSLYESIMNDVAKTVKRHINELSLKTVHSAFRKNAKYGNEDWINKVANYKKEINFSINDKYTIFDKIKIRIWGDEDSENEEYFYYILYLYKNGKHYSNCVTVEGRMDDESIISKNNEGSFEYGDILEKIREDGAPCDLVHILSRNDAKMFTDLINKETGLNLNFRNFLYNKYSIYNIPKEFRFKK